jgi:3',5'-nucleoside bisphosphate phosphatase
MAVPSFARILRLLPLLLLPAFCLLQAQNVRLARPTPKVGEFHVLKADLHMHTVFSDGEVWPTTRVLEAWREDLDVISISDHDDYHPHEKDVTADLNRPFAIASPVAQGLGILLVPGVEITKGDIHFNALFVTEFNAFRGKELQVALAEAKRQGAFSFWNHPGWKGTAQWWPPIATAHSDKLFQGIEVVNGNSYYAEAHPWVGQHKLTILSNSDIHRPSLSAEERSLTLLFARDKSLDGVREALDSGRTVAWQQKRLIGSEALLTSLFRAYVQTPAQIQPPAGTRTAALQIRNDSALHFDLKVVDAPKWMTVTASQAAPQSTALFTVRLAKDAPVSRQRVTLRLEVSNALAGPNTPLVVPVEFDYVP